MSLGLKGLEAAAVTAPGGYELPTIAMKGGNHHRRDFKHRNRNFRRRDRRHNNGNESSENEKVFQSIVTDNRPFEFFEESKFSGNQFPKFCSRMKVAITKQKSDQIVITEIEIKNRRLLSKVSLTVIG